MALKNTRQTINLPARVLGFFHHYQPTIGPGPLLVAVSGGPDSVCLFHLLLGLRDSLGIKLHVTHLDHQIRGDEAAIDARYVGELARRFDIPSTIEARDVRAYQARKHLSLEEAAREVRYAFFAEAARETGAATVAVGHTQDDNIETILMHLIRGTGTRGLRGLLPVTKWYSAENSLVVIRPLIEVSRHETQQYCRDNMLETRTDQTNSSLSLFRNRIRLELRPMLENYNPQVSEALLRTSAIISDELSFLEDESRQRWHSIATRAEDTIILNKQRLLTLPVAMKRHLLRMAIEESLGNLKDIETRHIEDMMNILEKPAGRRIILPEGLVFIVEYDRYLLGPDPARLCPFPLLEGEVSLNIPGVTCFSGWQVTAEVFTGDHIAKFRVYQLAETSGKTDNNAINISRVNLNANFDYGRLSKKLMVRPVQSGDRFQPLGLCDLKKVGKFMIDAKIPRNWRQRIPIVTSPEQIIWVAGWRIDERMKVTENTKEVLHLEFSRTSTSWTPVI